MTCHRVARLAQSLTQTFPACPKVPRAACFSPKPVAGQTGFSWNTLNLTTSATRIGISHG